LCFDTLLKPTFIVFSFLIFYFNFRSRDSGIVL